jgi:quinol monooxygenase YgiN
VAVVQVTNAPSRQAYDSMEQAVNVAGERPAGLIVHAAAETEDGSVLIVDVWESDAAMDAFERERLFPAFQAGGMGELMRALPTRHQAFAIVRD